MQNAGIAALGLNWRYLALDVSGKDLRTALEGAKAMNFIGLNLTVPHKLHALKMVDALDASARDWGAVNTVLFEGMSRNGKWQPLVGFAEAPLKVRSRGFNTDAEALGRALKEDLGLRLRGAKVLLIGAGGAGRSAALKLASERIAALFLVNRTQRKARALAREIKKRYPQLNVALGYPSSRVDLLLNATSLGLKREDPMPLDTKQFSLLRAGAVYDMVYRPAETLLLKKARAAGCRTANGLGMLLYQGTKALELWSGQKAPETIMRRALEQEIYG